MVFYRKYRPQTIEELDSKEVRDKLTSILFKKTFHALLFTGPKGLGKTSTARIVAKVLNCEKLNDKPGAKNEKLKLEPCNKCSQCVSIANGTNIDVLEIDGASNRGIDEIRDLREKVKLSTAGAFKKVYIIDEVHMLTTEAFNALLKTLEEPPVHVVFILCTTEPHKVPPTISSRCFHIAFKKATREELIRSFTRIVKREKIAIDKEALVSIADLSDGSFRDGAKILEEVSAGSKRKITKEVVEEEYQISNISSQINEILICMSEKNTKKALFSVQKIVSGGSDMKYFLEQLISELHNLLLRKLDVLEKDKRDSELKFNIEDIKRLLELFASASAKLKYAVLPELPLEMAIIEWCEEDVLQKTRQAHLENDAHSDLLKKQSSHSLSESLSKSLNQKTKKDVTAFSLFSNDLPSSSRLGDKWQQLIEKIKPYNHSVAGVLRGCSLKSYDGEKLVIEAKFKFHKERLEERKTMEILEKVLKEMEGKKVNISVVLK